MTVDDLNALSSAQAADVLRSCCGAARWVSGMITRRPFASVAAILDAADEVWSSLGPDDWREAFAHHPRLGDRRPAAPQNDRAAGWSAREQAAVATASSSLQDELASVNQDYERRFGHIYIVSASGKSAADLLALARQRMRNEPAAELRIAADEQRKITKLRLQKLFTELA